MHVCVCVRMCVCARARTHACVDMNVSIDSMPFIHVLRLLRECFRLSQGAEEAARLHPKCGAEGNGCEEEAGGDGREDSTES